MVEALSTAYISFKGGSTDVIWSSEEKDCDRFYFIGRTHAQHWLKSDANAFFVETFFMSPCFVLADCRSDSV